MVYQTTDYVTGARRSSEIVPASQDVAVPAHLLRATGNLGSKRDKQHTAHTGGWDPLPENPFIDSEQIGGIRRNGTHSSSIGRTGTQRSTIRQNSSRVHRNDTQRSTNIDRTRSESEQRRSVRFSVGHSNNNNTSHHDEALAPVDDNGPYYHRLSYIAGSTDVLTVTPRESRAPTPTFMDGRNSAFSSYSNENPFESKANSIKDDPFATENNSPRASFDATPQQPEAVHHGSLRRKSTLRSVVGGLQRRVTNASYFQRSELFGTYEKAKKKGVEIQRKKWVQITFEYSLYLLMILFIYFVLIGMPLWRGAVWWMYWVVETKFVLPGGFGITLGIALL
jgi:hypothetical protein